MCAAQRWRNKMEKKLKIGVVVADGQEFKPFKEMAEKIGCAAYDCLGKDGVIFDLDGKADVAAVLCGVGKVNAAAITAALLKDGCDIILNYGLSGGISRVRRGETVIANRFMEHDFDLTPLGYKPCEKPDQKYIYDADRRLVAAFERAIPEIKSGTAVCGDRFICSEDDRIFFKENFDAMSCDMETAAIASVCDMCDVPFASLRRISDDAGDEANDAYRDMNATGNAALSELFFKALCAVVSDFGGSL